MININNKDWNHLCADDVCSFLLGGGEENFFFEFKADQEKNSKLIKEISAFANTYGGYLFLGVNDDKTIGGCLEWTEQRIHATIHDSISPTPIFDIKKFEIDGKTIYIIKIEEGKNPPYVTNQGGIFERLASGSFPIKESAKLNLLYQKKADAISKLQSKIELPALIVNQEFPQNICGYIDVGFSLNCSQETELRKQFSSGNTSNVEKAAEFLKEIYNDDFTIACVGAGYQITVGKSTTENSNGEQIMSPVGINNFIEIMFDGSVRFRILLTKEKDSFNVNLFSIIYPLSSYREVYKRMMGSHLDEIFVSAEKYQKLTVLKQFIPYYKLGLPIKDEFGYSAYLRDHQKKYGGNIMVMNNRIPQYEYALIDKRNFDENGEQYNYDNLIDYLFSCPYIFMGYIDKFKEPNKKD